MRRGQPVGVIGYSSNKVFTVAAEPVRDVVKLRCHDGAGGFEHMRFHVENVVEAAKGCQVQVNDGRLGRIIGVDKHNDCWDIVFDDQESEYHHKSQCVWRDKHMPHECAWIRTRMPQAQ